MFGGFRIAGLVVAHTHLYSTLARGMPPPAGGRPHRFADILEQVWWRLDRALDLESIRMSARVGIAEAVRAGATCIIDHHESPNAIEGSLDVIADEMQAAGVRGVVAYGLTARNRGEEEWRAGLAENERFLRDNRRPLVRGLIGVHACFTVPDEALAAVSEASYRHKAGIHIHVAEGPEDREAVSRLIAADALANGSIYAHCVHCSEQDRRRLAASGGLLVQNARSNMANGVGYAKLGCAGDRVSIGTDGWDGDILAEARALVARSLEAGDGIDILARLRAGRSFVESLFGSTEGDAVFFDYEPPTPVRDFAAHLLSGAPRIREVHVAGKPIAPTYVAADAREVAARLWARMAEPSAAHAPTSRT